MLNPWIFLMKMNNISKSKPQFFIELSAKEFLQLENQILFEDNHLLIVNKKASQIVQGDKTGDASLLELFRSFIKKRDQKPGNVYLGVIHRLDRPVSGVLAYAKTDKALSRMNELVRERAFEKTYWAIVKNKPPKMQDNLVHWLRKNEVANKAIVSKSENGGGLRAELNYKCIATSDRYYLLEVDLCTGRHHQIRAQLAAIGCPIKGDLKYGDARSNPDASISLHARKIGFIHPIRKEKICITADCPKDPLWDFFYQHLASNC